MKRIVKFLRLPFIEKQLLLKSAFLLIAFKVGLSLFSFKSLLSYLDGIKQQKKELKDAYNPSEEKIVWVINVVSRYVPYTTCLSKALTDDCHNIVDTFSCHDIVDSHQFCSAGITTCN
jgi:hypothetical protein